MKSVLEDVYRNREAQLGGFWFPFLGGCEEAAVMTNLQVDSV